jgi:hypothetical protein
MTHGMDDPRYGVPYSEVHVCSEAHKAQIATLEAEVKLWKRRFDNLLSEIKGVIDDFED